jgi:hypothetical protein
VTCSPWQLGVGEVTFTVSQLPSQEPHSPDTAFVV